MFEEDDESNPYSVLRTMPDAWVIDKDPETLDYGNLVPVMIDGDVVWLMEAKKTFGGIICIE
jgi:hypothetical protein